MAIQLDPHYVSRKFQGRSLTGFDGKTCGEILGTLRTNVQIVTQHPAQCSAHKNTTTLPFSRPPGVGRTTTNGDEIFIIDWHVARLGEEAGLGLG